MRRDEHPARSDSDFGDAPTGTSSIPKVLFRGLIFIVPIVVLSALWFERAPRTIDRSLQRMTEEARESAERTRLWQREQRAARRADEVTKADERQRDLEARCYVITSDGRKLSCTSPESGADGSR